MGGGPHCQVLLQKLSSGFWTKKQNPNMLEPDDPGNHPAQPLPKCSGWSIHPDASWGEKKYCGKEVLEKVNCRHPPVGDPLCTLT